MTARDSFFRLNQLREQRRQMNRQSNGYNSPMFPIEDVPGVIAACDSALAGLDYGAYMDKGDGLGLDDIAGFDYGYDEAVAGLAGLFDAIWSGIKTIGSVVATGAGYAWKGAKFVGTNLYAGTKIAGGAIIKGISKLPTIAKKAYSYASTARITYPVRWVIQAGKTVGKWVYNGVKWLFQSPTGQAATPPKGAIAPTGAPSSININPGQDTSGSYPGGTTQQVVNINTGQQPEQYVANEQQPVYAEQPPIYTDGSGSAVNTGGAWGSSPEQPIMAADGSQIIPAATETAGGINPLIYVAAGLAALLFIIPAGKKSSRAVAF